VALESSSQPRQSVDTGAARPVVICLRDRLNDPVIPKFRTPDAFATHPANSPIHSPRNHLHVNPSARTRPAIKPGPPPLHTTLHQPFAHALTLTSARHRPKATRKQRSRSSSAEYRGDQRAGLSPLPGPAPGIRHKRARRRWPRDRSDRLPSASWTLLSCKHESGHDGFDTGATAIGVTQQLRPAGSRGSIRPDGRPDGRSLRSR
jgi:hypothetical protein